MSIFAANTFTTSAIFRLKKVDKSSKVDNFINAVSKKLGTTFNDTMDITFIKTEYFTEYLLETFETNNTVMETLPAVIYAAIDWKRVVHDLSMDYNFIEVNDEKYHYLAI